MKILEELFFKTYNTYPTQITPMRSHGSNRQYFRLYGMDFTCIGVYNEDKQENIAFINYDLQLTKAQIKVPTILAYDIEQGIYLQQDLGNQTLYSLLQECTPSQMIDWYKKALKELVKIQTVKHFDYTYAYPRKAFDRQSIRWDLNYFKYYFIKLANIDFNEQYLENDFSVLEDYLLSFPCDYFLYRDFQSRNIMVYNNELYFIDFQGARKGALQYDVASLLFSSKTSLNNNQREQLLHFYMSELSKVIKINQQEFEKGFYVYSLVRIMQAMGSYGYRGYYEGKASFLMSIPKALDNIKYLISKVDIEKHCPTIYNIFYKILNSSSIKLLSFQAQQQAKAEQLPNKLTIEIVSFSYKKGFPKDLSGNGGGFVFDCRALPNPGRQEKYRGNTGLDDCVKEFFSHYKEVDTFIRSILKIINQSIEKYLSNGYTHLCIYFGCTGGQHRSVYCANMVANYLMQNTDLNVIEIHREQFV